MKHELAQDYLPILQECFSKDSDLCELYHVEAPASPEYCAKRTAQDLNAAHNFKFFTLKDEDKLVGYFGHEHLEGIDCLTGFFIAPEYRNKEHVAAIWSIISNHFEGKFVSGIYAKNTRAANFLAKNGKLLLHVSKDGQEGLLYGFNLGD